MHTNRRSFLGAALAGVTLSPALRLIADAQTPAPQPPVSSIPAPRDWSGQTPLQYPDADIVALDPRFRRYVIGNTPIKRLHTGTL